MSPSLRASVVVFVCLGVSLSCRRPSPPPKAADARLPQVSGTIHVDGLSAPVRIARDRWGVPHIDATTTHDLFFAQGFVQAQDRLFQMDLWRRSVHGRLADVLGANFIDRDVMTRRVQYRGDLDAEWAAYGPDVKAIAAAFVSGINAWVTIARQQTPEEFVLAGWLPEFWRPEDLLARTDAFVSSSSAIDEVRRARLVAALGTARADRLLPPGAAGPTRVPPGLDPARVSAIIGDVLRRVGTPPFFLSLAETVGLGPELGHDLAGSNAWVVSGGRSATGSPLLANDPHRAFAHPALRYLVHLRAPGWNVIGATSPWLPGVAIGHNDRIAWGMTASDADGQDLYVERVNPANPHQVLYRGRWVDTERTEGAVTVRGRSTPFAFDVERTPHGIVIAIDSEHHLAFALRWIGTEPGTAGELGALALDRARTWPEFRAALSRWRAPARDVVYADADGGIGRQMAALLPVRRGSNGAIPSPGWTGAGEWDGWRTLDQLPHAFNASDGLLATADSAPRQNRLGELFSTFPTGRRPGVNDFKRWQHETRAWNAAQLVPLLAGVTASKPMVEEARQQLLEWDKQIAPQSTVAAIYVMWERALARKLVEQMLEPSLLEDYLRALAEGAAALATSLRPRDEVVLESLDAAVDEWSAKKDRAGNGPRWGTFHAVVFTHPLAVTAATARRFNVGPFEVGGYRGTLQSTSGAGLEASTGASFRQILDVRDWDRSIVTMAPGQSGAPGSSHFADLATMWAAGEYFQLAFGDRAVQAATESVLTLVDR